MQHEAQTGLSGPECGHSACSQNFIDTGEKECVREALSVTIYLDVHHPAKFAAAAVARAIEDGVDPEDAAKHYSTDSLTSCARMLFDPGKSPPGCEILDSSADSVDVLP